ncbi:hypothetical protein GCM10010174_19480 [Kutzneria viridogrisea]|uniref:Uncharacterized protein n=2 Tax=Kutzneria TaxID=43356 RepID=W5WMR6_9PSEU|nr:hypothetical protein [Kutzneria albida]AHH99474.1 hypothetical protein KALB_6114 [Kutzneria albida DSM 43870]MBA8922968.1 hypothetical protein [Kutzneria viridogrisea]
MTVHVAELHTEVVPAAPNAPEGTAPKAPIGTDEEHWRTCAARLTWLAQRVRAEGYDD